MVMMYEIDPPDEVQQPSKKRIEVTKAGTTVVVAEKTGVVNFGDKVKAYYHTVITLIGAILIILNEVTPVTSQLGDSVQNFVSGAIVLLTAILNALKSNEQWVNKL